MKICKNDNTLICLVDIENFWPMWQNISTSVVPSNSNQKANKGANKIKANKGGKLLRISGTVSIRKSNLLKSWKMINQQFLYREVIVLYICT